MENEDIFMLGANIHIAFRHIRKAYVCFRFKIYNYILPEIRFLPKNTPILATFLYPTVPYPSILLYYKDEDNRSFYKLGEKTVTLILDKK